MDFFEHQERARRKTHVLVGYFALAVAGIIVATYALVWVALFFFGENEAAVSGSISWWKPQVFLFTAAGVGAVVFCTSAFKTMQLSGGGGVVARELGGREVDPNTTDYHEQRLVNVVEEMAIAAGVPVPTVYVLDREDGINAFAAGRTPSDAVIGVTRGCMMLLSRDELQGVIAHEFSHILNGDMRLNIRLMGILFGILFLALIGGMIMRGAFYGSAFSSRRESAGGGLALAALGLGLVLIGQVGSFFARLIKASVSRQREFLADASAVQFTRNPDGLAGALAKIGGYSEGSKMQHPMADDASHFFFSNALASRALATHPPLPVRIRRILPDWGGEFRSVSEESVESEEAAARRESRTETDAERSPVGLPGFLVGGQSGQRLTEDEAVESLRSLHPEQVELGHELREGLPKHWVEACHSSAGARGVVFALLLSQDGTIRQAEKDELERAVDEETSRTAFRLADEIGGSHSTVKLALLDLAIPSLRHLSPGAYRRFRERVDRLVSSDRQVDLFEFALLRVITRRLDLSFEGRDAPTIKVRRFDRVADEVGVLLSTLAAMSHPEGGSIVQTAFSHAANHLKSEAGVDIPFKSVEECSLDRVGEALDRLAHASPVMKRRLLEACSKSVLTDGAVSSREAEFIRAIADAMGCPIPPFVRSAPLA